jgi:hypothetical protein
LPSPTLVTVRQTDLWRFSLIVWAAPISVVVMDSTGNWLGNAWTAVFAIYCVAVLPLLGWAIAHAG